jgi:hypothetical protein
MVRQIESLNEPYRGNALHWLEGYLRRPITDLDKDIHQFVGALNPIVRDRFIVHTWLVLEDAVRYFGKRSP